MYFLVAKLTFDSALAGPPTAADRKDLASLVEKIRSRFKVSVAACSSEESAGADAIAVAALGSSEERLSQTLDAIAEFCETAGFGRVESEETLMDDLDALGDYEE